MCGTAPFIMYIAMFILTLPAHFAVRGSPKIRNEQCKELGYEVACTFKEKPNACQVLTRARPGKNYRNGRQYISHPIILRNGVPDYTECGESKESVLYRVLTFAFIQSICMSGNCIAAPMPHYRSRVYYVPCTRRHRGPDEPVPTRHEQCQRLGLDVACLDDVRVAPTSCTNLNCEYNASDEFFLYKPHYNLRNIVRPLRGTRCGSNGACLKNKCIPLNEWLSSSPRPTYTGQENWDICRHKVKN